jgi:hypothetical protein
MERSVEVFDQIMCVFQSNGHANKVLRHVCPNAFDRSAVLNKTLGAPEACGLQKQTARSDYSLGRSTVAVYEKRKNRSESTHLADCHPMMSIARQSRIHNALNVPMLVEVRSDD